MSQFNLYLERVQETRNYDYQDLEVYDESITETLAKAGVGAVLIATLLGSALGIKKHADEKAHKKDETRMTQLLKIAGGYDMGTSNEKAIDSLLPKIYEEKQLSSANEKALRDYIIYDKLAPAQKENVDSVISVLRNKDNYKTYKSFKEAFHAAYKLVTKHDYKPNPYIK